jgi:hypothetical protein
VSSRVAVMRVVDNYARLKSEAGRWVDDSEELRVAYDFVLRFQLDDEHADVAALVERPGEAGCDDAAVGMGKPGRIALHFIRKAWSAERAMRTACVDLSRAIPDARLIEAALDLVGLTDVAELVGYTIEPRLLETATVAMRFNVAKETQMLRSFERGQLRSRAARKYETAAADERASS